MGKNWWKKAGPGCEGEVAAKRLPAGRGSPEQPVGGKMAPKREKKTQKLKIFLKKS